MFKGIKRILKQLKFRGELAQTQWLHNRDLRRRKRISDHRAVAQALRLSREMALKSIRLSGAPQAEEEPAGVSSKKYRKASTPSSTASSRGVPGT